MAETIWKNGKFNVKFTKEEKRRIRKETWKKGKWTMLKAAIIGFCISFFGTLLIRWIFGW